MRIGFFLAAYATGFTPVPYNVGTKIGIVRPTDGAVLDPHQTEILRFSEGFEYRSPQNRRQVETANETVRKLQFDSMISQNTYRSDSVHFR
ncbi:MAG TPA: hypothetical protein VHE81_16520 [Lacipirellulaceae bacterium]|nr:hypothetical protein [Lacipirellulaceae bacterium]